MNAPQVWRGLLAAALCARWRSAFDPPRPGPRPATGWPVPATEVLAALAHSPAAPALRQALGEGPLCRLDFSHARHGLPAHQWHQDGALRHDFMAHHGQPAPADTLLAMRTVWIALTPCGDDAPGLQWVQAATPAALLPAALTDEAVAARYGVACRAQAQLQAGDALIFDGRLLHRTHITAAMTQPRTSLELRFFPAGALHPRLGAGPTLALP